MGLDPPLPLRGVDARGGPGHRVIDAPPLSHRLTRARRRLLLTECALSQFDGPGQWRREVTQRSISAVWRQGVEDPPRLKESGVEPILLPPRSPNLNAHCERFVRSIKEEALEQMVMLGEHSLSYAIQQYLAHYHHERNHQGLGNQRIAPEPEYSRQGGAVVRRDRLGGLLSYYYRDAA